MGEYVAINRHPTWMQRSGRGDAVLLLHGGFTNSDGLLDVLAPLAADHELIAFDRRGHGRTADTDAPFHYSDMADETIGLLEHLGGQPAHLVGYSDGGNVALLVALQRPDLVRSLVLIGANYHADGVVPGLFEEFDADSELVQNLMLAYGERSPDGAEHFPVIIEKESAMIDREPSLTPDDLRRIPVPALVLVGDDDAVLLTHTLSLYESLPLGQLAVIPGASHLVPFEKPELVAQLVIDFLRTGGATATMMPVRRAQHARTPS